MEAIAIIGDIKQQIIGSFILSFNLSSIKRAQNGLFTRDIYPDVFFICSSKFALTNEDVFFYTIFSLKLFLNLLITGGT